MADQDHSTNSPARRYPRKDLVGQRFGRLVVLRFAEYRYSTSAYWQCLCDCGTSKIIAQSSLRRGATISCGCFAQAMPRPGRSILHGHSQGGKVTRAYGVWQSMIQRCINQNHKSYMSYGGRGILVCKRWRDSFAAFLEDMGEPPKGMTIERKDNDGHYELNNCRWVTPLAQANNRRKNVLLTHNGITHTLAEWTRILGFPEDLVGRRLKKGWSVEDAMFRPLRITRNSYKGRCDVSDLQNK